MTEPRSYWKRGEQARLAYLAEVSPQHLSQILSGAARPSRRVAQAIARAASEEMGLDLTFGDVYKPLLSTNPLIEEKIKERLGRGSRGGTSSTD